VTRSICGVPLAYTPTDMHTSRASANRYARNFVSSFADGGTVKGVSKGVNRNGWMAVRGDLIVAKALYRQTKKAVPSCDCHYYDHQVCDICQGVRPAEIVPGDVDNLTVEEINEAVRKLVRMTALPGEPALEFARRYQAEIDKIEARGWKMGLSLSERQQTRTRRASWLLKAPKKVFAVVYAFYNQANFDERIFFHVSECSTKREALERISKCPAPTHNRDKAT